MDQQSKDIRARLDAVKRGRQSADATLNVIRAFMRPDAPSFVNQRRPSAVRRSHILDNTGEDAAGILSSAIHGALFPQNMKWFAFGRAGSEGAPVSEAVRRHQEHEAEVMRERVFEDPDSEFATNGPEWVDNLVNFAYSVMFIEERRGEAPAFIALDPAECYLVWNAEGRYTELWRVFRLSAKAAKEKWPTGLSDAVNRAAEKPQSCDQEFEFVHAVYRRPEGSPLADNPKKQTWASVYYDCSGGVVIREGGYPEQPFMAVRYRGAGYGRCPTHKAINDIVMLQRELRAQIEGAETLFNPPVVVPDDGILGNIKLYGGAVMTARSEWLMAGRMPLQPVTTGARVDIAEAMIQGLRDRIKAHFLNDKLLINRDPKMTATMALQDAETLAKLMAGTYGRIQAGLLSVMIPRVHGICRRNGWFKPPPSEIQNIRYKTTFLSPFARQQDVIEARATAEYLEIAMPLEDMEPGVRRRTVDPDLASSRLADALGVPFSVRVPVRLAKQLRAQDQQNLAEADQTDKTVKMANAAAQIGAARERFGRAGAA